MFNLESIKAAFSSDVNDGARGSAIEDFIERADSCIPLNGKDLNINITYASVQLYSVEGCQRKRIAELSIDCSR